MGCSRARGAGSTGVWRAVIALARTVARWLGPGLALGCLSVPALGAEPAPRPSDPDAPARSRAAQTRANVAFEGDLGAVLWTRRLEWEGDPAETLRGYRLVGVAPGVAAQGIWYPGAHTTRSAAAHVGLLGRYFRGFPRGAQREGRSFNTRTQEYELGLRGRIPFRPFELGLSVAYGAHDYEIDWYTDPDMPVVASVGYRFFRPGLEVRLRTERWVLELSGGLRVVGEAGELGSSWFFPELAGYGLDGTLGVGRRLTSSVTLLATGGMERYQFALRPDSAAPGPLGSAERVVDQYTAAALLLRWSLPGVRPGPGAK